MTQKEQKDFMNNKLYDIYDGMAIFHHMLSHMLYNLKEHSYRHYVPNMPEIPSKEDTFKIWKLSELGSVEELEFTESWDETTDLDDIFGRDKDVDVFTPFYLGGFYQDLLVAFHTALFFLGYEPDNLDDQLSGVMETAFYYPNLRLAADILDENSKRSDLDRYSI